MRCIYSARSVIGKCVKYESSVGSRSSYGQNRKYLGISKDNLILSNVYLIVITIVIFTHKIIVTGSLSKRGSFTTNI